MKMIEIRFARFSFSTNLDCCNFGDYFFLNTLTGDHSPLDFFFEHFSDYLDQFTLYLLDFCPRVYEGELLIFALLRDNKFWVLLRYIYYLLGGKSLNKSQPLNFRTY